jgi:hypothetical protein
MAGGLTFVILQYLISVKIIFYQGFAFRSRFKRELGIYKLFLRIFAFLHAVYNEIEIKCQMPERRDQKYRQYHYTLQLMSA